MSLVKLLACFLMALFLSGCHPSGTIGRNTSTNLSVIVWPSFPPPPNSYNHQEHLQKLVQQANALIATNPAIFSQKQAYGRLKKNSPLRGLLGIPADERADMEWSQSSTHRHISIRSSETEQGFGSITVNLATGGIDSVYDVKALFLRSEMGRRLRQIIGTREEALRLFGGPDTESPSPEQKKAIEALAEALFLPKDREYRVQMSAPGGTNRGQGYLRIYVLSSNSLDQVAGVFYPTDDNILSAFGIIRPTYKFSGPSLLDAWTNLNTAGFLLDNRLPFPKP